MNAKNFAIFAHSFRKYCPQDEAIVFVNSPVPERHSLIAAAARIRIVEFDMSTLQPEFIRKYHPSSIRWILFHRLLVTSSDAVRQAFSRVVMVDIRDTAFQSDPFALLREEAGVFHVFGEQPGVSIETCGWNSGWVKDCFGEDTYNAVRGSPIVCSGVSMGTMDAVGDYLSKMSEVLLGESDLGKGFPACERTGVDQGAHNVLVHTGALKVSTVQYEKYFPVVNLQSYPQLVANAQDPAILRSETGVLYALVHQYDRLSTLQSALAERYVDWVRMGDPRAEWAGEPACATFSPVYDQDLFRGKCELGSERLISAASCCQSCLSKNTVPVAPKVAGDPAAMSNMFYGAGGSAAANDYPAETVCSSFAFVNGVCYMKRCRQTEVSASLSDPNRDFYREMGAISAYVAFTPAKTTR